jgi:GAF domain-containing protein
MERYDAILEQLRKAQTRGMETITNRLDYVVQSLEELIHEAKSSVQGALPESADEFLPIHEIEVALETYRQEAEAQRQRCTKLEARIGVLEQTADRPRLGASIALMRALDGAGSQSELLKELLPALSEHAARGVVLVLRDGRVTAWSGIGFANGEVLRSWQGDVAESSALSKLLEVSRPVRFAPAEDELFRGWFAGEREPSEILLIPVVLRGRLMGTVYVDRLDDHPWNPEAAQTLVAQVCWLIDTLQYRQLAAPSLAEPVEIGHTAEVGVAEPPPVVEYTEPESEAEAEPPVAEAEEAEAEPEPEETTAKVADDGDRPGPEVAADRIDPSATMKIDVSGLSAPETATEDDVVTEVATEIERQADIITKGFEPEEPTTVEFEDAIDTEGFDPEALAESAGAAESEFEPESESELEPEPVAVADDVEWREPDEAAPPDVVAIPSQVRMPVTPPEPEPSGSRFLDEPPPVQPVQPPPAVPEEEVSEDEAKREEARRFARLLVSEIKLYNEEQVERGRESKDIYHRLREDIDRSREMFEKRISAEVRASEDYFQDELVRVLADGDSSLLGM